jgi:hypothetical protein
MLRNSSSPETYFQAAFRVQNALDNNKKILTKMHQIEEIVKKHECYVFDFTPDRALRQIVIIVAD